MRNTEQWSRNKKSDGLLARQNFWAPHKHGQACNMQRWPRRRLSVQANWATTTMHWKKRWGSTASKLKEGLEESVQQNLTYTAIDLATAACQKCNKRTSHSVKGALVCGSCTVKSQEKRWATSAECAKEESSGAHTHTHTEDTSLNHKPNRKEDQFLLSTGVTKGYAVPKKKKRRQGSQRKAISEQTHRDKVQGVFAVRNGGS